MRGTYSEGGHSRHDDNSDDDFGGGGGYFPPIISQIPPNSRRQCRNCRKYHQQIKDQEKEIRELRNSLDYVKFKDQEKGVKLQEVGCVRALVLSVHVCT